jgi:hypothetical protein
MAGRMHERLILIIVDSATMIVGYRHLADFLARAVDDRHMPYAGGSRHIERNLRRNDNGSRGRFRIISTFKAARVSQAMTVLHVEKIARHVFPPDRRNSPAAAAFHGTNPRGLMFE